MINQIRHAQNVIRTLNANGLKAFVAGGAPRDWLLGRRATDIDVFILSDVNNWAVSYGRFHTIQNVNNRRGFEEQFINIERVGGADNPDVEIYQGVNGIESVHNSRYGAHNINVQLIFVRDFHINSVVERFPDICQAWMPNNGPIRATSEFFRAHDQKYSNVTRNNAHTQKLRDKFPDYNFINNEEEVSFTLANINYTQDMLNRIRENGDISTIRGSLTSRPAVVDVGASVEEPAPVDSGIFVNGGIVFGGNNGRPSVVVGETTDDRSWFSTPTPPPPSSLWTTVLHNATVRDNETSAVVDTNNRIFF